MLKNDIINDRLQQCILSGELDNAGMKLIMQTLAHYLGLKTLNQYATERKISYVAARKHKLDKVIIADKEFIIDNE